jgi:GT2 family glycosyltransferase
MVFEHHHPAEFVLRVPLLIKPPAGAPLPSRDFGRMDLTELGGVMIGAAGLEDAGEWAGLPPASQGPATTVHSSVALGMQAGCACIWREPFKLVRFHLPGQRWPWPGASDAEVEPKFLLFGGEGRVDETRDIAVEHPGVVRELGDELEILIPESRAKTCALAGGKGARVFGGTPEASVIIVDHNGRRHMGPCLASLRATTGVPFEVIVVDNDSTDGSPEAVERDFPEVRVLRLGRNAGFGAANRRGVEVARGRFLVFLNNDTVVEPGWLEALVRAMDDESIAAACSTLVYMDEPHLYNARGISVWRLGFARERDVRQVIATADEAPPAWDTIAPTGAAMMVRRGDFVGEGGFDPAMFMYYEDVDLGWRLRLAGRRVVAVAGSVVLHHGSATTRRRRTNRWKHRMGHRHLLRTLIKCYEWPNLRRALKGHLRLWARERDWGMMAAVLGWNAWHLPSALRERARIQRGRRVSDRELFGQGLLEMEDIAPALQPVSFIHRLPRGEAMFPTRTLMPGQISAQGRLGDGWQLPEFLRGESVRWTGGVACCHLVARPGGRGLLRVELALDQHALTRREVVVACNGVRVAREPDCSWQEFVLPVVADAEGRLDVTISPPCWRPVDVDKHSNDSRTLGCMVRLLCFEPEKPEEAWQPATATVAITPRNRRATLEKALAALATDADGRFDVVVVDDGSTDGTWEALQRWRGESGRAFKLKIFHQTQAGPAVARNLALRAATGDIVIFLGEDAVPEPGFVAAHLARQRSAGEPCVVAGRCELAEQGGGAGPFLKWVARQPPLVPGRFEIGYDGMFSQLDGANLSVARKLPGARPFDEKFDAAGWETVELCYRLASRGAPVFQHDAARVRRERPVRAGAWLDRQKTLGRQLRLLHELHPELRDLTISEVGSAPLPWPLHRLADGRHRGVWDLLDRAGVRLPRAVYRAVGDSAFLHGWEKSAQGI